MKDLGRTRDMAAGNIIEAYTCRFKIETMFREMEQQRGGFCYPFWTHAVPRLNRYRRKGSTDPLAQVRGSHQQHRNGHHPVPVPGVPGFYPCIGLPVSAHTIP